jgi:hypothetical protein
MSKRLKKFKKQIKKRIVSIPFNNGGVLDLIMANTKPVIYTGNLDRKEFEKFAKEHFKYCGETKMKQLKETRQRLYADWEQFEENNNNGQ